MSEEILINSTPSGSRVALVESGMLQQVWLDRIEEHSVDRPLFDLFGIEDEIEKALKPVTPLKSGGSLVFDQTETMTTIDVNTGAYIGHRNLEETIYKTNLEATHAIARQLRLRNLVYCHTTIVGFSGS